jgi:hypothetical protein
MAQYIANRFSTDGLMNLDLAQAVKTFGDSHTGKEILYFEYIQAIPLLQEIAIRWLSQLPEQGTERVSLVNFLEMRLGGRSVKRVSDSIVKTFKSFGKLKNPKPGYYCPIWSTPSLEAFLYVLARMYPERTMVRVEMFMNDNMIRSMLWPTTGILELLKKAEHVDHISKISQLDQYHQFTLSTFGSDRMKMLLLKDGQLPMTETKEKRIQEDRIPSDKRRETKESKREKQIPLFRSLNESQSSENRGKKRHAR